MKRLVWGFLAGALLIGTSCSDNPVNGRTEPSPPQGLLGIPMNMEDGTEDLDMVLMWVPPDQQSVDGYNVYRKIGTGNPEKLNSQLITESPFGPDPGNPAMFWFADTNYDTSSASRYAYYATAVSADGVSDPSDTVICVPNTLDRHERMSGLSPDAIYDVDENPVFNWEAKEGASSYLIFLYDELPGGFRPWWGHRLETTECAFKCDAGFTYLDAIGEHLLDDHEYSWVLEAIDDNNCGFAEAGGNFSTGPDPLIALLVDEYLWAGLHRICWDQKDEEGSQVPPGTYEIHATGGNSGVTYLDSLIRIEVSTDFAHVPSPLCDTLFGNEIPDSYSVKSNASTYAVGDTIAVDYSLPIDSDVRIVVN